MGFRQFFGRCFLMKRAVGSGSNVWIIGYSEVTNIDIRLVSTT